MNSEVCQIVGIALVQNDDRFLETAIRNVLDFCDHIIIVDHASVDRTNEIATFYSNTIEKVSVHRVDDPVISHSLLLPYVNTNTWVLGVDGDEIYDPQGLASLRARLIRGDFNQWWVIFGNVVNCTSINLSTMVAAGYMAPPSRSMTKLYNFSAICEWGGKVPQRLHGGKIRFNDGFDKSLRLDIYKTMKWEEAEFRCLHMCFLKRSSIESDDSSSRMNVTEKLQLSVFSKFWWRIIFSFWVKRPMSRWKLEKYSRGDLVTVDISPFFTIKPRF